MATTERIVIDPASPEPAALRHAARVLARGGLVAFPTETVYGLGARALDASCVARIFAAKGRPPSNPVIVHSVSVDEARALASTFSPLAEALAARFWPGPITLVVPRAACVPLLVTAGGPTVALRVPAHPVALGLLRSLGEPIAAPSANASGFLSPTTANHVLRSLDGLVDLLLDGGPCSVGIESTVVDVTGDAPRVLRPGGISREAISAAIGALRSGDILPGPSRSPGLLASHYRPETAALELVETTEIDGAIERHRLRGTVVRVLTHSRTTAFGERLPSDPETYAASLYARLHALDAPIAAEGHDSLAAAGESAVRASVGASKLASSPVERTAGRAMADNEHEAPTLVILVERPPEGDAWEAVHDRLRRAATRP